MNNNCWAMGHDWQEHTNFGETRKVLKCSRCPAKKRLWSDKLW